MNNLKNEMNMKFDTKAAMGYKGAGLGNVGIPALRMSFLCIVSEQQCLSPHDFLRFFTLHHLKDCLYRLKA